MINESKALKKYKNYKTEQLFTRWKYWEHFQFSSFVATISINEYIFDELYKSMDNVKKK